MKLHYKTAWAGGVLGLLLGWAAGSGTDGAERERTTVVVRRDTITLHDTVTPPPRVVREYVTRLVRDTLRLAAAPPHDHDTTPADTTAAVTLPITRRVYADTAYRAVVSGYRPQLDSLTIYVPRRVVSEERILPPAARRRPRFSLGLQVGFGTDFRGFSPYIGIGLQYNLLTW